MGNQVKSLPPSILAPWAITEEGLRLVIATAESKLAKSPEALLASKELEGASTAINRDGVAVIPVNGPLVRTGGIMSFLFGDSSYETIKNDFSVALNDSSIKAITFDFDTPGGESFGCGELAAFIKASRGRKPIIGYISGMCCSAGFWIASACDRLVADPSSMIGSIGVRTMMVDYSAHDAAVGVKPYDIVSSQSPYKVADAADEGDRLRARDTMTAIASVFVSAVADGRNVSEETVLKDFGKGDVFIGQAAIDAGLIDELGDLESLIASLQSTAVSGKPNKRGKFMAAKKSEPIVASMKSVQCDGCDRDMDDDDETYCLACHGGASAEATFGREVVALVGGANAKQAIGLITALKAKAEESDKLRAELEVIKGESAKAELSAMIDAAMIDGRVTKAKREEIESLAAKHGVEATKAYLSLMTPAPVAAKEVEADPKVDKKETVTVATGDFAKILAATGLTAEQYAEHQKKYRAITTGQSKEEN